MTRRIAILGAGGSARELYWHIRGADPSARIVFVDDVTDIKEIVMAGEAVPVVKHSKFNSVNLDGDANAASGCWEFVVGVGAPGIKRKLVRKAVVSGLKPAPTVVHPRALVQGSDCDVWSARVWIFPATRWSGWGA